MADLFDSIEETHRRFIEEQHLFFVATAPSDMEGEGWRNFEPREMADGMPAAGEMRRH